jgi:tRNA modification GTPase
LIAEGCRYADPGEFTKRAFLHNKLDLTQEEAVADIIHAQSRVGAQTAARQLAGGFTRRLSVLRQHLLDVCGLLELELDFSEEDVEFVDRSKLRTLLAEGQSIASTLASSAASAEILRSGLHVAVVGYPNAGKSSLFNALLARERALVSDTPGTTRDYLEESIVVQGYTIRLFDTAGLRSSNDTIEMQGVRLTASLIDQCNMVLVVNDVSLGADHSSALVHDLEARIGTRPLVVVQNKSDLLGQASLSNTPACVYVSANTGLGVDALRGLLAEHAARSGDTALDVLVNARQAKHLQSVADLLGNASANITAAQPIDVISVDVRSAIRQLGELSGETWHPDVLESIFSRFCIGK